MKTHKPHCTSTDTLSDDLETQQAVKNLDTWLAYWRPQLFNVAWNCVDLPNHPPDRLATHVYVSTSNRALSCLLNDDLLSVFIQLEARENAPSPQQFFTVSLPSTCLSDVSANIMYLCSIDA